MVWYNPLEYLVKESKKWCDTLASVLRLRVKTINLDIPTQTPSSPFLTLLTHQDCVTCVTFQNTVRSRKQEFGWNIKDDLIVNDRAHFVPLFSIFLHFNIKLTFCILKLIYHYNIQLVDSSWKAPYFKETSFDQCLLDFMISSCWYFSVSALFLLRRD